MFSTDFILFSLGGIGVSLLELLSVLVGLTCVFLAGRARVANFWFGYVYAILLLVMFAQKHLYFSMALQPVSLVINFFGHYRWTHPRQGEANRENQLKITHLEKPLRVRYLLIVVLFALILGWSLQQAGILWPDAFPPARHPYIDALVTMTILLAQYLSARKKLECWYAWMVANTTNIILSILAGLVFMPIVCACYLVLAFFGFSSWRKTMKEQ